MNTSHACYSNANILLRDSLDLLWLSKETSEWVLKVRRVRRTDLSQGFGCRLQSFDCFIPSIHAWFGVFIPSPLQTEENIPLRLEGTIRTSFSSLGVSLRVSLSLLARLGSGTDALLSRCQAAKFWATAPSKTKNVVSLLISKSLFRLFGPWCAQMNKVESCFSSCYPDAHQQFT